MPAARARAGVALAAVLLFVSAQCGAAQRFVAPAHPAAQDVGHGSHDKPWRTLAFAMSQLRPGDRLEIAAGVYREAMVFPEWAAGQGYNATVIEGKGRVVIKGSVVVSGWRALGNGRFVKAWPKETAQVFVDGVLLQQVGGTILGGVPSARQWPGRVAGNQDTMPMGSFYYQHLGEGNGNLYIRVNRATLNDRLVEVSTLAHVVIGKNVSGVTLRNLEFTHGNTSPVDRNGLVLMTGSKIWLDRIKVTLADTIGIELAGNDNKLTNSISSDNGKLGLKARGSRVAIRDSETSRNNWRRFDKWNEAGGAKFVGDRGLQDSVIVGHKAIGNHGDGVWFDWHNNSNRIDSGIFAYNAGFGIHYEASHGAVIVNNLVVGNGQRGIYLLHSSRSVVAFNLVAGNTLQGVVAVDERARDPGGVMNLKPLDNLVFGNIIGWNKGALVLPADLASNRSNHNVFAGPQADTFYALGWSRSSHRLGDWVAASGQDRDSSYLALAADPGVGENADSIARAASSVYVSWLRAYRAGAAPLPVAPAWLAAIPGGRADTRVGPNL